MATLLASCAAGPVNNVGFANINDIAGLEGKYKNRGEGYSSHPVYLSGIIWPDSDDNNPIAYEIDTIEIKKIDENTLIARGFQDGVKMRESTFVHGKDFIIKSGRIHLGYESEFIGLEEGQGHFLGADVQSRSLGIDERSDGKYRNFHTGAGLFFIYLPMVALGYEDVRFVRIDE